MIVTLVVVGILCQALAWRLVARGVLGIWTAMSAALGFAGLASLLTGTVELSPDVDVAVAVPAGLAAGAALYLATRVFVLVVRKVWPAFVVHAMRIYGQRGNMSLAMALLLALGGNVIGEELFWRGLVQERAMADEGVLVGALLAWAAYVLVNVCSGSLAIVAGAVVGGGAWTVLAAWTGGVLAAMLCHAVWTGCMIAFPPLPTARPATS